MKYLFFNFLKITLFCTVFLGVFSVSTFAQKASLVARVSGLRNNKGKVLFALYKDGKNWLTMQTFRNGVLSIKGNAVEMTFTDLEPGNYGVSFYHDENNNKELDKNFMGIPTECFGFSNINGMIFSKPDYSDCKFTIQAGENKVLTIKLLSLL